MTRWKKTIHAAAIGACVLAMALPVRAQEYVPVDVNDVKVSPQRFWARGIVFRDVLKEHPGDRTLKIDGRTLTRLSTEKLGDVYAEEPLLTRIAHSPLDTEYLFSATISQREKKSFLIFGGGRKYIVTLRDMTDVSGSAASLPDQLANINRGLTTNIYNRVFASLESIMADVQKDLFAYATSQNIPIETVFDVNAGHMAKVTSSIHAALRRAEQNSKTPVQEYLVNLIVAMMAMQNGYVEPAPQVYVPEALPDEPSVIDTNALDASSWDLSVSTEPEPAPEPEVEPEPTVESEPAPETAAEIDVEPVAEPALEEVVVEEAVMEEPAASESIENIEQEPTAVAAPEVEPTAEVKTDVEVIGPDDPFWQDTETVPAVETNNTPAVDVEAKTEEAALETPNETPVAEPSIMPLDDPFWSDPAFAAPESSVEAVTPMSSNEEPAPVEQPVKKKKPKKKKVVEEPASDVVAPQDKIDETPPAPVE
jgi:hypothetical protein